MLEVLLWDLLGWLICAYCLYTGYTGFKQWRRHPRTVSKVFLFPLVIGVLLLITNSMKLF